MTTIARPTATQVMPPRRVEAVTADANEPSLVTILPIYGFVLMLLAFGAFLVSTTPAAHAVLALVAVVLTVAPSIAAVAYRLPGRHVITYATPVYVAAILLTPTLATGTSVLAGASVGIVMLTESITGLAMVVAPATLFAQATPNNRWKLVAMGLAVPVSMGMAHAALAWPAV